MRKKKKTVTLKNKMPSHKDNKKRTAASLAACAAAFLSSPLCFPCGCFACACACACCRRAAAAALLGGATRCAVLVPRRPPPPPSLSLSLSMPRSARRPCSLLPAPCSLLASPPRHSLLLPPSPALSSSPVCPRSLACSLAHSSAPCATRTQSTSSLTLLTLSAFHHG